MSQKKISRKGLRNRLGFQVETQMWRFNSPLAGQVLDQVRGQVYRGLYVPVSDRLGGVEGTRNSQVSRLVLDELRL